MLCTRWYALAQPRKDFSHIEDITPLSKKTPRAKRKEGVGGLPVAITVNRSDSKWSDSWQSQQATTLKELGLEDMAMDFVHKGAGQRPSDAVLVDLIVQKVKSYILWIFVLTFSGTANWSSIGVAKLWKLSARLVPSELKLEGCSYLEQEIKLVAAQDIFFNFRALKRRGEDLWGWCRVVAQLKLQCLPYGV